MKLSNRVYDVLKIIALRILPPLGTLAFAITQIWHLPYGAEIEGTIFAVATCLSVMLGLSSMTYNKTNGIEDK